MRLAPGTRVGSFEILSSLGEGGMGAVYRARDTKLNRDVAVKVLLPAVANDPERLARFQREAQVLASLNHPHIAAIYGLEDAGETKALVLELVEGPTLADRIATGPIPLGEALPIAKQIAEALEAAHEQGTIHRDLKPAIIKVRLDGTVKLLDFGLAKATEPGSGVRAGIGDVATRIFQANGDTDVTALLPRVSVPTLVLHAREDARVPFEAGRRMAAGIPGARFVTLTGRNHLFLESDRPLASSWSTRGRF